MKNSNESRFKLGLSATLLCLICAGCLQTRTAVKEQEEKQVLKTQVKTLQQTTADSNSRFSDFDEELRRLNGRIETVESKQLLAAKGVEKADAQKAEQQKELNEKLEIYKEAITKVEQEVASLQAEVQALKSAMLSKTVAPKDSKSLFAQAEEFFAKKQFDEAALAYGKFQKANPNSKQAPIALYKTGVCFQEMSNPDDAESFYREVIAKYPKSAEAAKAETKLKSLKKKK